MRTLDQWRDLAASAVMFRGDTVALNAVAAMCWSDEQAGGVAGVWHSTAVYYGHRCACYHCIGSFNKAGNYPGRTGEGVFA